MNTKKDKKLRMIDKEIVRSEGAVSGKKDLTRKSSRRQVVELNSFGRESTTEEDSSDIEKHQPIVDPLRRALVDSSDKKNNKKAEKRAKIRKQSISVPMSMPSFVNSQPSSDAFLVSDKKESYPDTYEDIDFEKIEDSSDEDEMASNKIEKLFDSYQKMIKSFAREDHKFTALAAYYGVGLLYCPEVEGLYKVKKNEFDENFKSLPISRLVLIDDLRHSLFVYANKMFAGKNKEFTENMISLLYFFFDECLSNELKKCHDLDEIVSILLQGKILGSFFRAYFGKSNSNHKPPILDYFLNFLNEKENRSYLFYLEIFRYKLEMLNRSKNQKLLNQKDDTRLEEVGLARIRANEIILLDAEEIEAAFTTGTLLHSDRILAYIITETLNGLARRTRFIQYDKASLPEAYRFESLDVQDYLSNIRLSVRFVRRYGKRAFFSDASYFQQKMFTLSWIFKDGDAELIISEQQKLNITRMLVADLDKECQNDRMEDRDRFIGRLSREMYLAYIRRGGAGNDMEMVANLGGHEAVETYFELFKITTGLTDQQIASLARNILHSQWARVVEETQWRKLVGSDEGTFISCVTYLLFGCEARRNPASLIIHQMVLDLIEFDDQQWKKYLRDGESQVPMSIEYSAGNSFVLFSKNLISPYYIEGSYNHTNSKIFYQNHQKIISEWSI